MALSANCNVKGKMMSEREKKEIMDSISVERRAFVSKAVKAGFSLPVVATFTMTGLMATPAAAAPNMS